jgi:hypothetical protein
MARSRWKSAFIIHLVATVAKIWIPVAAELTAANAADNEAAPELLCRIPSSGSSKKNDRRQRCIRRAGCCRSSNGEHANGRTECRQSVW